MLYMCVVNTNLYPCVHQLYMIYICTPALYNMYICTSFEVDILITKKVSRNIKVILNHITSQNMKNKRKHTQTHKLKSGEYIIQEIKLLLLTP